MADSSQKFQAPKGTRDFYPADMAVRRYIESVWREVSVNHGFEEIDGPTFEHLELYTKKSGEEIVKQLFSFRRADGDTDYALRPEFTPTLARMYAARAGELAKPTKWFCMPSFFRAERPQRGRLREFQQWNIDFIGGAPAPPEGQLMFEAEGDAEIIYVAVDVLKRFGLTSNNIRIKLGHRGAVRERLLKFGIDESRHAEIFSLLDQRFKLPRDEFLKRFIALGLPTSALEYYDPDHVEIIRLDADFRKLTMSSEDAEKYERWRETPGTLPNALSRFGILDWCEFDSSIIRGLAYYTGMVFEVHEASGKERAIAGGGRYDKLIELFGGPPTPAVGFAMGDVVLRNVLEDRGLLPDEKTIQERLRQRVDAFVFSAKEEADTEMSAIVSELRAAGLHARQSYKATRNVGKLLGDAGKCFARTAILLGDELNENKIAVKNLESGEQVLVDRGAVVNFVKNVVRTQMTK